MPKVYTLLNPGTQQTDHWQPRSNSISQADIEKLNTGDDDVLRSDPTSLPTPFARIDLFDTAFKKAAADLKGQSYAGKRNTWYNLKVSHALDLAQLLFEYDKHKDKLKIIAWNKDAEMDRLRNHQVPEARAFGKVLGLFLEQDSGTYGFEKVDSFYIFYWRVAEHVIGGTSPATLLFTAGNNLAHITAGTSINGRPVFQNEYEALHERPIEFQQYLHQIGSYLNHASYRPLHNYLEESKAALMESNQLMRQQLDRELQTQRAFQPIFVNNATLRFCGVEIGQAGPREITEASTSLLLKPGKAPAGKAPLVLPNWDRGGHEYPDGAAYEIDLYNQAEAQMGQPIELRRLPREGSPHPFLIANDLLADSFLLYNYLPNSDAWLLAPEGREVFDRLQFGYVLPLKPKFFDYFTAEDLIAGTQKGDPTKPRLQVKPEEQNNPDMPFRAVQVILTLPSCRQRPVSLTRTYFLQTSKLDNADGRLIEVELNAAIFPFVQKAGHYRVGAVGKEVNQDFSIRILDSTQPTGQGLDQTDPQARTRVVGSSSRTVYHAIEGNLDALEVTCNGHKGVLIPRLKEQQQLNREVHFSIDFGTSNTHIEYMIVGQADAQPFAYQPGEGFVEDMISERADERVRNSILRDQFWFEFLPPSTDGRSPFHLPRRTALFKGKDHERPASLRDVSFAFGYSMAKHNLLSDAFVTNLKWGNDQSAIYQGQVRAFIDQLALLIWAKALAVGANLSSCQVVWFYPISMVSYKRQDINALWKSSLNRLFSFANPEKQAINSSESYAPYMFYKQRRSVLNATGASVLIDIGGGTTDILYFNQNNLLHQGSLRYAGGHVFGNGFNTDGSQNGYFLAMRKAIEQHEKAVAIIDESLKGNDSDLGSLLFALKNNGFDFAEELKERSEELKCIPLAFFLTVIFHVAKLGKSLGALPPNYLLFSGNGSRILRILVTEPEAPRDNALLDLSARLIAHVYGLPEHTKLEIRIDKDPKVLTAKGGLEMLKANAGSQAPVEGLSLGATMYGKQQISLAEAQAAVPQLAATVKEAVDAMRAAMANPSLFEGLNISKTAWDDTLARIEGEAEDMLRQGLHQREEIGQDTLSEDPWVLGLAGQFGLLARQIKSVN